MNILASGDGLYKGETFVVLKQKSNYYDLSKWIKDKEQAYENVRLFYQDKGGWMGALYDETQTTQEVLATLNNNFEIEGRYSRKGYKIK